MRRKGAPTQPIGPVNLEQYQWMKEREKKKKKKKGGEGGREEKVIKDWIWGLELKDLFQKQHFYKGYFIDPSVVVVVVVVVVVLI